MTRALPALATAGILAMLGHRSAPLALIAVAAALILLGWFAPDLAAAFDRGVARVARALASWLARLLGIAAFLLGVLPAWGWSRLSGTGILRERHPGGSAWRSMAPTSGRTPSGGPAGARRSGSLQRGFRQRPLRPVLVGSAATLLSVAVAVAALSFLRDGGPLAASAGASVPPEEPVRARVLDADEFDGLAVDEYAHEEEPWAPAHFGELRQLPYVPDPFLGARLRDFRGEHVNVVDGRRASWTPPDPELTVWFFGGSTMFGIGQRDDHTIPSVVAQLASDDGTPIRAHNFGVSGYVNWQEVERFEQALTSEEELPDLVVFYDGVNDRGLASQRIDLGDRRADGIARLPLSDDERAEWHHAWGAPDEMPWSPERERLEIELAAQQYRRGAEIAQRLAAEHGIRTVFVWQPQPFAKRPSPADDPLWERLDFDPDWLPASAATYRAILERSGVDAIDLTRALDHLEVPVYFDSSHTNELGARVIGDALHEELAPVLAELLDR